MSVNAKQTDRGLALDLGLDGDPVRYKGACHCQKIQFELDHSEIKEVTECNCSICTRRGALFVYTTGDRFHITAGALDDMTLYLTSKRVINHYFCRTCGCAPFSTARNGELVGVNARALIGFQLKDISVNFYDGATL